MKPVCLTLLMSAALSAAPETVLKAGRAAHVLVLRDVYLNGQGPFRTMIDTGAASCIVHPAIASRLGLRPVYTVEMETAASVKRVAAAIMDEVRVGPVNDRRIEVMVADLALPNVDGVLGQSWLVRHDYMLDYRGSRLVVDAKEPVRGIRVALRSSDGRPEISAEVNGRRQDLVLDSGASVLILFRQSPLVTATMLVTDGGSLEAGTGSARVAIGGNYSRLLTTAEVNASPRPGLLPTGVFRSVYISIRDGVVVLVP